MVHWRCRPQEQTSAGWEALVAAAALDTAPGQEAVQQEQDRAPAWPAVDRVLPTPPSVYRLQPVREAQGRQAEI